MAKRRATTKRPALRVVPSDPIALLREEARRARAEGWDVRCDVVWVLPHVRRVDPIGVLIRNDPARLDAFAFAARAAEILGWSKQRLLDFVCGFRGRAMEASGLIEHYPDAWEMGRAYRAEVDRSADLG